MRLLLQYLVVGAAGFVGAAARLGVGQLVGRWVDTFPLGTMVINLSGSFFLGWFLTYMSGRASPNVDLWRIAIATGFTGAYTTFSTWMFESHKLLQDGADIKAAVNLVGSLVLGLTAMYLGVALARR